MISVDSKNMKISNILIIEIILIITIKNEIKDKDIYLNDDTQITVRIFKI